MNQAAAKLADGNLVEQIRLQHEGVGRALQPSEQVVLGQLHGVHDGTPLASRWPQPQALPVGRRRARAAAVRYRCA